MKQAFVENQGSWTAFNFDILEELTQEFLYRRVSSYYGITPDSFHLVTEAGKTLDNNVIGKSDGIFLKVTAKLLGGKGGFGTQLKAQGDRMAARKTENIGSCRDLSGKRLRSIAQTKIVEAWTKNLPQIQKLKKEKLKRKIESAMRDPPKKKFQDNQFVKDCGQVEEAVEKSVFEAIDVYIQRNQRESKIEEPIKIFGIPDIMDEFEQ